MSPDPKSEAIAIVEFHGLKQIFLDDRSNCLIYLW